MVMVDPSNTRPQIEYSNVNRKVKQFNILLVDEYKIDYLSRGLDIKSSYTVL